MKHTGFYWENGLRFVDRNLVINGFHLFYVKGDLLLRIKTQGDPGPRFNQARLSVANLSNSLI